MAIYKSWLLQFPKLKIINQIGFARSKEVMAYLSTQLITDRMCLVVLFSFQRTNRRLFAYQGSQ